MVLRPYTERTADAVVGMRFSSFGASGIVAYGTAVKLAPQG
jgi:uncharacterized protein YbjQ (UPF0145 family)